MEGKDHFVRISTVLIFTADGTIQNRARLPIPLEDQEEPSPRKSRSDPFPNRTQNKALLHACERTVGKDVGEWVRVPRDTGGVVWDL